MPSLILSTNVVQDLEHLLHQIATRVSSIADPSSSPSSPSSSSEAAARNNATVPETAGPGILTEGLRSKLERSIAEPLPIEQDEDQEGKQGGEGKLTGTSPAIPPSAGTDAHTSDLHASPNEAAKSKSGSLAKEKARTEGVVVHHDELVELASQIRQLVRSQDGDKTLQDIDLDWTRYTLNSMLRGARFYFPPKPKYIRPPELEASLARIRARHEADEYASMSASSANQNPSLFGGYSIKTSSSPTPPHSSTHHKSSYTPVVPTERGRGPLTPSQEAAEWALIRRTLSAILNVLVSMGGVATALYWAASSSAALSVPFRTLLALAGALLVGGAEAFLYVRSFSAAEESEKRKMEQLKGFAAATPALMDDDTLRKLQEEQMRSWKEADLAQAAQQQRKSKAPVAPAGHLDSAPLQTKARQRKNKGKPK